MLRTLIASLLLAACGGPPTVRQDTTWEHKPPPDAKLPPGGQGGMEVEGLLGRLDDYVIQEVIGAQMAGFNNCFKRTGGNFVAGEVQLSFKVGRDGRVAEVFVSQSDLGSFPVEDCLVQAARFLEFPPPDGGPAKFIFPFAWQLERRRITRAVEASWGYESVRADRVKIRECRATHRFDGPFHVTLYVGPRGRVLDSGFHATRAAADFPACIYQTLGETKFPDPGARTMKFTMLVEDLPDA